MKNNLTNSQFMIYFEISLDTSGRGKVSQPVVSYSHPDEFLMGIIFDL